MHLYQQSTTYLVLDNWKMKTVITAYQITKTGYYSFKNEMSILVVYEKEMMENIYNN